MDEFNILIDEYNQEHGEGPKMPILVFLDNGVAAEAKTVRGAIAIVLGSQYLDAEDEIDEWNERVIFARKESMRLMGLDMYAVTWDERRGIIPDNHAGDPQEEDYQVDLQGPVKKIRVETERGFLFSLAQLGTIKLLEREGSHILTNRDEENEPIQETRGGDYLDISVAYDLDELIERSLDEINN